MKELHNILTDNIHSDRGITVTIDRGIPKTTVRINQSETMILYGIGKQNEPGFALCVSIDQRSNEGKRIIATLAKGKILNEFKSFDDKTTMIYVADFKTDIDSIVNKTIEVLDLLKTFTVDRETKLIIDNPSGTHTLK